MFLRSVILVSLMLASSANAEQTCTGILPEVQKLEFTFNARRALEILNVDVTEVAKLIQETKLPALPERDYDGRTWLIVPTKAKKLVLAVLGEDQARVIYTAEANPARIKKFLKSAPLSGTRGYVFLSYHSFFEMHAIGEKYPGAWEHLKTLEEATYLFVNRHKKNQQFSKLHTTVEFNLDEKTALNVAVAIHHNRIQVLETFVREIP